MRNVVQFKDKDDNLYAVKDIVARATKANADNLYNYKTASGNIVTVDDAEAESAKRIEVAVDPVQDLHGYDNPWPAGGGKNKLPFDLATMKSLNLGGSWTNNVYLRDGITITVNADGTIKASGQAEDNVYFTIYEVQFVADAVSGTYILNGCPSGGSGSTYNMDIEGCSGSDSGSGVTLTYSGTLTKTKTRIRIISGANLGTGIVFKPMIRLATESDATFAPYENNCPISGWTGTNVSRTGKNLFDGEIGRYLWSNGVRYSNSTGGYCASVEKFQIKGGADYAISIENTGNTHSITFSWFIGDTFISTFSIYNATSGTVKAPENANMCALTFRNTEDYTGEPTVSNVSVSVGTTASSYEPYSGSTAEYEFPQEAGTVYGGKLTIRQDGTGTLAVDRVDVDLGTLTWQSWYETDSFIFNASLPGKTQQRANPDCISSMYKYRSVVTLWSNLLNGEMTGNANNDRIYIRNNAYNDNESFKAGMNGVQLVYTLATPVVYTLTNQQVLELLAGTNNIWSSTGSIEIDYPVAKVISKDDADERYAGMIYEETESAPIASITDGAGDVPLKKLEVAIEPVQDLHGQDAPFPPGSTPNIWDEQWEIGSLNTSTGQPGDSDSKIRTVNYIPVSPNTEYSIVGYALTIYEYGSDKSFIGYTTYSVGTFTTGANTYFIKWTRTATTYNNNIAINYPSSVTTYSPYSNICPIYGWESANVSRTGKNLFDKNNVNSINAYFGGTAPFNFVSGSAFRTVYIPCKPSTTYTVKKNATTRLFIGYANKTPVAGDSLEYGMSTQNGVGTITTGSDAKYLCCYVYNSTVDTLTFAEICNGLMIELGSTASTYEAFSGSTAEYEFPQTAGTVYGGSLTIHQDGTGELVVDHGFIDTQSNVWTLNAINDHGIANFKYYKSPLEFDYTADIITNLLPYDSSSQANATKPGFTIGGGSTLYVRLYSSEASTDAEFKQWASTNGLQILLKLATPVTYQLTNQQVLSLLKGNNVLFADCGAVSIVYPCDTRLFIEKKIAELQALILENL